MQSFLNTYNKTKNLANGNKGKPLQEQIQEESQDQVEEEEIAERDNDIEGDSAEEEEVS